MKFKLPKNDHKYLWTNHVLGKMMYYGISEGVIRRVVHTPHRAEEGVAPNTVAVMQKAGSKKHPKEIWVMYQKSGEKKKIITAWRYPGVSPVRSAVPVPEDILKELMDDFDILLNNQ